MVALAVALAVFPGMGSAKPGPAKLNGVTRYSLAWPEIPRALHIAGPDESRYILSLSPQFDVSRRVVVIELTIRRAHGKNNSSNLFDPTSKWHGYQKWIFAASDFASGAVKSVYGKQREIDLRQLGMEMQIDVTKVIVVPIGSTYSKAPCFRFAALKLEISVRNVGTAAN